MALCNERYLTNFRCHQCSNTFDTISSISSIGSVTGNITPFKCKSCRSTTAIFESLSGQFKSIPVLLPIELGHIVMEDFPIKNRPTFHHQSQRKSPLLQTCWL